MLYQRKNQNNFFLDFTGPYLSSFDDKIVGESGSSGSGLRFLARSGFYRIRILKIETLLSTVNYRYLCYPEPQQKLKLCFIPNIRGESSFLLVPSTPLRWHSSGCTSRTEQKQQNNIFFSLVDIQYKSFIRHHQVRQR